VKEEAAMATALPVPLAFELADGWAAADPHAVGADGAAFVARRLETSQGFIPTITIDGRMLEPQEELATVADESRDALTTAYGDAQVLDRRTVGDARLPGLVQSLALRAPVTAGADVDLVQDQVYMVFWGALDPTRRALIRLVLTVSRVQHAQVVPDFQTFVQSVNLDRS